MVQDLDAWLASDFTPITVGAPEGYPAGYLQAGGEPYGRTYDASDPEDAAELASRVSLAEEIAGPLDRLPRLRNEGVWVFLPASRAEKVRVTRSP